MRTISVRTRQLYVGLLAIALLAASATLVRASHNFADVPNGSVAHDAVEWMVNRAITLGCAAGMFCPEAPVTRAQMALFMQRFGGALGVTGFGNSNNSGAFDLDVANLRLCPTLTLLQPLYPRVAVVQARLGIRGTAAGEVRIATVWSPDDGVTWFQTGDGFTGQFDGVARTHIETMGVVPLSPGNSYRFAVLLTRVSGTGDSASTLCEVRATVYHRNGATTPFRATNTPRRR
jgi:hypothetical protein